MAKKAKKRLEDKGATVPKNFSLKHALLHGASPNPTVSSIVLQDDVQKKDVSVSQSEIQDVLRNIQTIFKNIGEIDYANKSASEYRNLIKNQIPKEFIIFFDKESESDRQSEFDEIRNVFKPLVSTLSKSIKELTPVMKDGIEASLPSWKKEIEEKVKEIRKEADTENIEDESELEELEKKN